MLSKIILLCVALCVIYLIASAITTYISRRKFRKNIDISKHTIYLTFDDGCDKRYTPKLLDLLKVHNIKATFFVLGSTMLHNKEIILRMKNEGHLIACHGYEHKNHILSLPFQIDKEVDKCSKIFDELSIPFTYYRPTWGHFHLFTNTVCKVFGLKVILWNVIVGDWQKDITADILVERLSNHKENCKIICLHDGRGKNNAPLKTTDALEVMIPKWKKEGYTFETVDRLN